MIDFVGSWLNSGVGDFKHLTTQKCFVEGHGIMGGVRNKHDIWIPMHARNGSAYLWTPPPAIADVALEECMKAIHKQSDTYHVFLIPRLLPPLAVQVLQII